MAAEAVAGSAQERQHLTRNLWSCAAGIPKAPYRLPSPARIQCCVRISCIVENMLWLVGLQQIFLHAGWAMMTRIRCRFGQFGSTDVQTKRCRRWAQVEGYIVSPAEARKIMRTTRGWSRLNPSSRTSDRCLQACLAPLRKQGRRCRCGVSASGMACMKTPFRLSIHEVPAKFCDSERSVVLCPEKEYAVQRIDWWIRAMIRRLPSRMNRDGPGGQHEEVKESKEGERECLSLLVGCFETKNGLRPRALSGLFRGRTDGAFTPLQHLTSVALRKKKTEHHLSSCRVMRARPLLLLYILSSPPIRRFHHG
jgi:hypothetical protein